MRLTGRVRRVGASGLVALVALLLAAPGAATAPNLTDTFDAGDDGWSIYESGSIGPAEWIAAGGNPGGFLSHVGSGAGAGDAAFGDAGYVTNLSRYFGEARIVADMRTTAIGASSPTVRLVEPEYPALGSISSSAGRALSAEWSHHSFPLVAAAGWYDEAGDRLDSGELRRFLNLDPVVLVGADYGSGAGGRTDLDNVGIISEFPRAVSIRPKPGPKGLKGFKGRVTVRDGFDAPQCLTDQKVRILRSRKGTTRAFGSTTTNAMGRYALERRLKPGRYFARAPLAEQMVGADCAAATSKTIKVKR